MSAVAAVARCLWSVVLRRGRPLLRDALRAGSLNIDRSVERGEFGADGRALGTGLRALGKAPARTGAPVLLNHFVIG